MRPLCLLSLVVFMLAGCSPQITVYSDYDPDYDLWTYGTFDWGQKVNIEQGKNPLHYNELNDKRIKQAVREQMNEHGYRLTSDQPELLLHYHIIVDNQSMVTTEPLGYRYGPYWTRNETHVYSYRQGTLILDLMDTKTNNLVWRGWAVSPIENVSQEDVEPLIRMVVEKIFRKFPNRTDKKRAGKVVVTK
jgi:hypothetical protein